MPIRSCTPVPRFETDCYDWNERHHFCQKQARTKHADAIFIGDSITHFWASLHGGPIWERCFGNRNVLNIGFGWDRTPNVLWRLAHGHFDGQTPGLIVLNIGTNNFAVTEAYPGDTPEETADGIEAVIDDLQHRSPASHIVDMAVFPRGEAEFQPKVTALNRILADRLAGRKNVTFLNLTDSFLLPDGTRNGIFFRDGAHLTLEGYEIWVNGLRPYLARYAGIEL